MEPFQYLHQNIQLTNKGIDLINNSVRLTRGGQLSRPVWAVLSVIDKLPSTPAVGLIAYESQDPTSQDLGWLSLHRKYRLHKHFIRLRRHTTSPSLNHDQMQPCLLLGRSLPNLYHRHRAILLVKTLLVVQYKILRFSVVCCLPLVTN